MPAERLARSGSVSLTGSAFAAVGALVLAAIVGNSGGAYGAGLFFQAIAIFTIVSQVLRLGTNTAIVRQLAGQRVQGRKGEAWRTAIIALVPVTIAAAIAAVVLIVFSDALASLLTRPAETATLSELIRNMAPFIGCAAVLGVLQTLVRMIRGVTSFTVLQSLVTPLARLVAVSTAIVITSSVSQYFWGWMLPIPLVAIVTIGLLVRPLVADWRERRESPGSLASEARTFWGFSAARAVGSALETTLEWADVLIVAALASPAEAGIYAIATRTIQAGQVVDRAMRIAVSPTISALLTQNDVTAARDLHTSVTRAMILATWPYYLMLATLGPAVLSVFGEEFRAGSTVLIILGLAMMIQSAAGMLQSVLLQGGRSSWQMYNKTIALSLNVGLNLLLVPVLGIVGAAITWATGIIVETIIAGWQVHRRMGVSLEPRRLITAMVLTVAVFGVGGLLARVTLGPGIGTLVLCAVVLVPLYVGALWLMRSRLGIITVWAELPGLRRFA